MANRVYEWVDERTGIKPALDYVMYRRVPKSVNWFFTLGSASLTVFIIQAVSGAFLAMGYTPSTAPVTRPDGIISNEALESIRYTTGVALSDFGYWVRGFHHWGANLMVIVVVLHMLRVFFMGSYKYPREITWFTGVFILILVLGFAFTGYLLPWDNRAYWATQVGVQIGASAPFLGDAVGNVLRGGPTLGAATLTRFYAIHVLILPALTAGLIGVHLFLIIKIGISGMPKARATDGSDGQPFQDAKTSGKKSGKAFFPYIIFKDAVVSLVVVAIIVVLTIINPVESSNPVDTNNPTSTLQTQLGQTIYKDESGKHVVPKVDRKTLQPVNDSAGKQVYTDQNGNVVQVADPSKLKPVQIQPQPEWYFLFLFQGLKLFPTTIIDAGPLKLSGEALGGIIIPTILIIILFLVPFLDRGPKRNPLNRPWTTLVMVAILVGIVALSIAGVNDLNKAEAAGEAAKPAAPATTTAPAATTTQAPVTGGGTAVAAGNAQEGLKVFQASGCAGCHANNGRAAGVGPKLAGTAKDEAGVAAIIRNGKAPMPGYTAEQVSDKQLADLVAYIKSLK